MNTTALANIYRAELRRLVHRRATRVAAGLIAAALVFTGVTTFLSSSAAPPDLAAAERQAEMQAADCRGWVAADGLDHTSEEVDQICFVDPSWYVVDKAFHMQAILSGARDAPWEVTRSEVLERYEYSIDTDGVTREAPASGFNGELIDVLLLVAMAGAALGATAIGADWRSGMIESHAIWVPDRVRLVVGKLGAVLTGAVVLSIATTVLFVAVLIPSAVWRGDFRSTGAAFWGDVATTGVRGALATGLFALIAAGLAMVGRNTVAGIGGLMGWSLVTAILAERLGRWSAYLSPYANMKAFVSRGDVTFLETVRWPDGGRETLLQAAHGSVTASVVVTVLAALVLATAGASFTRRDIT